MKESLSTPLFRMASALPQDTNFEKLRDKCGEFHAALDGWVGKLVGRSAYDVRRFDENLATGLASIGGGLFIVLANPVGAGIAPLATIPFAGAMLVRAVAGYLEPRTAEQQAAHENVVFKPDGENGTTIVKRSRVAAPSYA